MEFLGDSPPQLVMLLRCLFNRSVIKLFLVHKNPNAIKNNNHKIIAVDAAHSIEAITSKYMVQKDTKTGT